MNKNEQNKYDGDERTPRLAYIIGTYPRLTTTFIDREIRSLRERGVTLRIISIRKPDDDTLSAEQVAVQQEVTYLLPVKWHLLAAAHLLYLLLHFGTYLKTVSYLVTRPHPTLKARFKTVLHFGEGVYTAYLLRHDRCQHLHAHFLDRAATVALVASRLLAIPYSVTAHANDIYLDPVLITEKLAEARFSVTCTGYNREHLTRYGAGLFEHKLYCIYHGLDASRYRRGSNGHDGRGGEAKPAMLLSVGQLKERKGFHYLLDACRLLLDWGYDFHCRIVGDGPQRDMLERRVAELGLQRHVTLCGALAHEDVVDEYRHADIFVLPAILASDGQRDGIPNVILEAMAMELPVVSTAHSGIPEVVADGSNGSLVPPEDVPALSRALAKLLDDGQERRRLGRQGRQTVLEQFDVEQNVARLLKLFRQEGGTAEWREE